jgi:hypothetical protein
MLNQPGHSEQALPPPSYNAVGAGAGTTAKSEIKLWDNSRERRKFDDMADLYAIIKTTEYLEKAFIKDAINVEQYESACARSVLVSQIHTNLSCCMLASCQANFPVQDSGEGFDRRWNDN